LRLQLGDVPTILAKDTNRRWRIRRRKCALVMRQQTHEQGFARTVRSKDRGVLAFLNRQPESVQYRSVVFDDGGVNQLEDGVGHVSAISNQLSGIWLRCQLVSSDS
jgi:hypothetical protein